MKRAWILIALQLIGISFVNASSGSVSRSHADNLNAWFMGFGTFRLNDRFGIHAEAQLRRADFIRSPQQLLLRTGLNYNLKSGPVLTAGYCFVETYPYGDFAVKCAFSENRLWEQLQIKTSLGKFEWISRYRLEQRFSKLPVADAGLIGYEPGPSVYTNRFRIMNRFSIPFKGKEIKSRSLYFSAYDELFVNFGHNVGLNYIDQNRAYAALGYVIPKYGKLELGYMEQTVIKSDGVRIEDNHTLQLGFFANVDFRNKKK